MNCSPLLHLPIIAPGSWYEIPNSKLRAVTPSPAVAGGTVNRITAWSSGALDPVTSTFYVWGGGHEDYAGNELYAFSLNTLKWERLTNPSVPDRIIGTDVYADGQPRSRHTYNYLEHVQGRLLSFGGAAMYPYGASHTRRISEFDPVTKKWVTGARANVTLSGEMPGAHARVHQMNGNLFFLPARQASPRRYNPQTNVWASGWNSAYVRVHSTAAIDPYREWLVVIGSGGGTAPQALRWNIGAPSSAFDLRPLTQGDSQMESAYAPGFDFNLKDKRFYAWAGGKDVYVLDPLDWKWTRHTAPAASPDPGPQASRGTYGRFRYVPQLDLFVVMSTIDRNVFVYRPPEYSAMSASAPFIVELLAASALPAITPGHWYEIPQQQATRRGARYAGPGRQRRPHHGVERCGV